ncbi:hypothetical protein U1Q18_038024 [Sarracenia purpurea var. burkii]
MREPPSSFGDIPSTSLGPCPLEDVQEVLQEDRVDIPTMENNKFANLQGNMDVTEENYEQLQPISADLNVPREDVIGENFEQVQPISADPNAL